MTLIVPSILSADFSRLGEEIRSLEEAGADWIHVDVMDGHFVPNLSMGPLVVEAVRRVTALPIDVHLMIERPEIFVRRFTEAGATHISVHAEVSIHLDRTLRLIRDCGAHPGIALGPSAGLSLIEWTLDVADYVDVLAVNPGFGGQELIPAMHEKIRAVRAEIARRGLSTIVESDGGINARTIGSLAAAGVDAFVVGSALFGARDYGEAVGELRRAAGQPGTAGKMRA